jgi:PAS domain S-box-containing protein
MPGGERTVLFVGKALKEFSETAYHSFKVRYIPELPALFHYFKKEAGSLQRSVIVLYFQSLGSTENFLGKVGSQIPQIFLFTPLIVIFSNKISDLPPYVLKKFDYTLFHLPERLDVEQIVAFVIAKKQEFIEGRSILFINQAIILDLFEKVKQRDLTAFDEMTSISDFYFGVDNGGFIKTIGDEVLHILGFSREEIIGRHFSDLTAREEFEKVKRAFTERRTGERRLKDIVVKLKTKDGRYEELVIDSQGIHFPSVSEHPLKDPTRVHVGTFGKARKKKPHFNTVDLFDNSLEPILIYNLTEKRLVVNNGFEKFSGYSKADLFDKNPEFFERSDRSFFQQCLKTLPERKHAVYNTIFVMKSGMERFCEVTLDLVEFNGNSSLIAIYNDISSLMNLFDEAETLIRLSWDIGNEASLVSLIEAALNRGAAILKVPFLALALFQEGENRVLQYYVRSGQINKWFTPKRAPFHAGLSALIKEASFEKKTIYRSLLDTHKTLNTEEIFKVGRDDIVMVSPLIVNRQPIGCIIVINHTDSAFTLHSMRLLELSTNVIAAGIHKLRIENELLKNLESLEYRVQARTKELEDFTYTVSHDLKSPLHAARGFADMVKNQFQQYIKNEEDSYVLKRIGENINQAISMINDLLKISRIGTKEIKPEKVDLNEIIEDYLLQFKALKNNEVKLDIRVQKKLPLVFADGRSMAQLLTNLFDNSIKYRSGKDVTISISGHIKAERFVWKIADNGIGIGEQDLPNVFKIFYRGRAGGGAPVVEGSGLGLTICKKIVEQHGGTIELESERKKGTTVFIELPLSQ